MNISRYPQQIQLRFDRISQGIQEISVTIRQNLSRGSTESRFDSFSVANRRLLTDVCQSLDDSYRFSFDFRHILDRNFSRDTETRLKLEQNGRMSSDNLPATVH